MLAQKLFIFLLISFYGQIVFADYDLYRSCRSGGPSPDIKDGNEGYQKYKSSVFRIDEITPKGQRRTRGTATLISNKGHFITAAHVLGSGLKLKLVPNNNASAKIYDVSIVKQGSPGNNIKNVEDDWAIILAEGWDGDSIKPVRLRYTIPGADDEVGGWFAGFPELQKGDIVRQLFNPAKFDTYQGEVFKGMSGSLLIDDHGWGFGIVAAYGGEDVTSQLTEDERREWLYNSNHFAAAKIDADDKWWMDIDPDETYPQGYRSFKDRIKRLRIPENRKDAIRALMNDYEELDFIKLEYLNAELFNNKFLKWPVEERELIIRYILDNGSYRCMPPLVFERTFYTAATSAGEAIGVARDIYRIAGKTNEESKKLQMLAIAEKFMNKGVIALANSDLYSDLSIKNSSFRSNAYIELAAAQSELAPYKESALEDAKTNLLISNYYNPNNLRRYEIARSIAIAENDWESAARITYDSALVKTESPGYLDRILKYFSQDMNYFARKDAEEGGAWGNKILELGQLVKWTTNSETLPLPEINDQLRTLTSSSFMVRKKVKPAEFKDLLKETTNENLLDPAKIEAEEVKAFPNLLK